MSIDPILQRVEKGTTTAADAEALRQAYAIQATQLTAQRQEMIEARAMLHYMTALTAQLYGAAQDYLTQHTPEYRTVVVQVLEAVKHELAQAATEGR